MATTKPVLQPQADTAQDVKCDLLAAGALIPNGTLACLDGANGAKPLTDTLMQAGATFLGVATDTYDNSGGGAAVSKRMLFLRATSCYLPKGKGGDAPTAAMLGKEISAQDNDTAKATIAGTDLRCTLVEVLTNGYVVRLP